MTLAQMNSDHDRFAVEWALPDDEIGPADVMVRICDTDVQPGESFCAHCPVCDNHQRMQSAITADGQRYDRCLGCGRLWHVDRDLGRVVGVRLVTPH
jgi:formate dehydrogenase maturation protein FdhE